MYFPNNLLLTYFMKKIFSYPAVLSMALVGAVFPAVEAGVSTEVKLSAPGDDCHNGSHNYFNHAPIGVMGDHLHHEGGLMVSYRYMFMRMQRNYDGDSQISDAEARQGYMASPTDMDMQMHMLGLMYAPSDKLTLMLMANYMESDMPMVNMMGAKNMMRTSGFGDTTLSALYSLYRNSSSSAHIGLGLSMPTGSIDEEMPNGFHFGYPMQLGSGTWDLKPSITWLGYGEAWSYGAQISGVIRLGENDNGYTLGDRISATSWVNRRLNDWSAVSLRLTASSWGNVDGHDDSMPVIPMGPLAGRPMAAPADPDARGGSRIDLSLGYSVWSSEHGARFAVEVGAPVYQKLDGPQLGTAWFLTAGLQFAW